MENGVSNGGPQTDLTSRVLGRPPKEMSGALWFALGSFASFVIPFFGVVMMGYGARELLEARGPRGFLFAVAEGIVITAVALFANSGMGMLLVGEVLCVLGVVWCMRNHAATLAGICAVIVATALVNIGIEAAVATAAGSSLSQVVDGLLAYMVSVAQDAAGTGIQAELIVRQIAPVLKALWPFTYVASAGMDALAAGIGSYLMYVRTSGIPRVPAIAAFDMPMWPVGVLIASILGLSASLSGFPGAEVLLSVSVTALMSVRFIFAIQGFAVVLTFANRFRFGCLGRTLLLVLSIWLETMFFIVSIVGLIDVWANFRKLTRGSQES
ncbi:hypothetical protein HMPREF9452_01833 [Collinsella tanakaei YIT 12063]|uniref:DUF2232 domain-containing protein n=2 Tax=Collinsella tanakaei TaxID=626935 RepID=G1WKH0_9ACTN|nr:hypothetical protein HMPREF9452_01833 [Collinsella tanakaei YIT 12063]